MHTNDTMIVGPYISTVYGPSRQLHLDPKYDRLPGLCKEINDLFRTIMHWLPGHYQKWYSIPGYEIGPVTYCNYCLQPHESRIGDMCWEAMVIRDLAEEGVDTGTYELISENVYEAKNGHVKLVSRYESYEDMFQRREPPPRVLTFARAVGLSHMDDIWEYKNKRSNKVADAIFEWTNEGRLRSISPTAELSWFWRWGTPNPTDEHFPDWHLAGWAYDWEQEPAPYRQALLQIQKIYNRRRPQKTTQYGFGHSGVQYHSPGMERESQCSQLMKKLSELYYSYDLSDPEFRDWKTPFGPSPETTWAKYDEKMEWKNAMGEVEDSLVDGVLPQANQRLCIEDIAALLMRNKPKSVVRFLKNHWYRRPLEDWRVDWALEQGAEVLSLARFHDITSVFHNDVGDLYQAFREHYGDDHATPRDQDYSYKRSQIDLLLRERQKDWSKRQLEADKWLEKATLRVAQGLPIETPKDKMMAPIIASFVE